MKLTSLFSLTLITSSFALACGGSDDESSTGDGDMTTAGDGDMATPGDGDMSTSGDGDMGAVGDGDAMTGDGDAPIGDGDSMAGDGDMSPTGDGDLPGGDGDVMVGDGDATPPPGDGDGAPGTSGLEICTIQVECDLQAVNTATCAELYDLLMPADQQATCLACLNAAPTDCTAVEACFFSGCAIGATTQ